MINEKETEKVEQFVAFVEDFVNTFDTRRIEKAGEMLAQIHPTLQQNFMRLLLSFVRAQAEKDYFDDRNEATVKLCKEILKALGNRKLHLPLV